MRNLDNTGRDSRFNRTSLSVEGSVAGVKRPFAVATGCSARLSWRLRAGADAKVATRGQAGGGRHEHARQRAQASVDSSWLPADALVELEGRDGRERRIGGRLVLGAGGLPQRRAAGRRDAGWRRRLTEVGEDVASRGGVTDKGDDPHIGAAERAHEWENFVDAGEQQRQGLAGGAAMGRFGRGRGRLRLVRSAAARPGR
jgi:hypothetical protein